MQQEQITELATTLHRARKQAQSIQQLSRGLEFTRSDAYRIQEVGIDLRKNEGEIWSGLKMGLTSEAKRKQMDLDSPLYGELTREMSLQNGGTYTLQGQIHPKIEPEIAVCLRRPMSGKITREQVWENLKWIAPAMEILDSRYDGFKYFSMEDVIADNSSSSQFIVGDQLESFQNIDIANLSMVMKVNGETVQTGNSQAISGDPMVSIIQLAELLEQRGREIPADCVILTGAATIAHPLAADQMIELEVEKLGKVKITTQA